MTRSRSNYLINRLLTNALTAEELEELLNGLDDEEYIYEYSDILEEQFERLLANRVNINPALAKAWKRKNKKREIPQKKRRILRSMNYDMRGFAAGFVILVSFGLAFYFIQSQAGAKEQPGQHADDKAHVISLRQESAPLGRRKLVKLHDGSHVKLNAGSKINYPATFNAASRKVEIEGEAFFDVTRDESKPFLIQVSDVMIKVLGTSFNVKYFKEEHELTITVNSGSVGVEIPQIPKKTFVLTKDQKLIFDTAAASASVIKVVAEEDISWIKGLLRFERTPLTRVEGMLERWYDVEIHVANDKLYNASLTGKHLNESLISVLESISYALGAEYEIKGRTIILK